MEKAISKTWELSLYELQRRPQEAVTDDTEITVNPRTLHSELMCPICLDIMSNTMTTKECLHRFCSECIITALRNGNKECPTCRKKLVSKRSLRHDPNFDALITKIVPSRAAAAGSQILPNPPDRDEESLPLPLSEPPTPGAVTPAATAAAEDTPSPSPRGVKRSRSGTPAANADRQPTPSSRKSTKKETLHQQPDDNRIDVILKYFSEASVESEDSIVKYIKIPPDAFIEHLINYIHLRHSPPPADPALVSIYPKRAPAAAAPAHKPEPLDKSLDLQSVYSQHGTGHNKPLELFFAIEPEIPTESSSIKDEKPQVKDEP